MLQISCHPFCWWCCDWTSSSFYISCHPIPQGRSWLVTFTVRVSRLLPFKLTTTVIEKVKTSWRTLWHWPKHTTMTLLSLFTALGPFRGSRLSNRSGGDIIYRIRDVTTLSPWWAGQGWGSHAMKENTWIFLLDYIIWRNAWGNKLCRLHVLKHEP